MTSLTTFVSWKWSQPGCRSSYNYEHVNVWAAMIERYFPHPKRILCVTDDPIGVRCETFKLWTDHAGVPNPSKKATAKDDLPSCYRRLKIFSEQQTRAMGIELGSRVVSMDLDVVAIKDLSPLFCISTLDFHGWKRLGPGHPDGYNASVFMFRTGTMDHIWETFDPKTSPMIASRSKYYGSDQGWIAYVLRGTMPGWGKVDGVYSFSSDVSGKQFPTNARLISFNGPAKPWHPEVQRNNPWIAHYWRIGSLADRVISSSDFVSLSKPRPKWRARYPQTATAV